MANAERQSTSESERGKHWRNVGLGLLAIGILGELALLAAAGVLVAAGGEIYSKTHSNN